MKLFAIKSTYSNRILKKEKLVEFRRQNVNVQKGEECLIYTSSPIKKITGYFVVKEKMRLPIRALWRATKKFAGITKNEFLKYFQDCLEGTAIFFSIVRAFTICPSLVQLRRVVKGFKPPQSYYNIDKEFFLRLTRTLSKTDIARLTS